MALIIKLFAAIVAVLSPAAEPAPEHPPIGEISTPIVIETPTILEDDPRWSCETMGNRECGLLVEVVDGVAWYDVHQYDDNGMPTYVRSYSTPFHPTMLDTPRWTVECDTVSAHDVERSTAAAMLDNDPSCSFS